MFHTSSTWARHSIQTWRTSKNGNASSSERVVRVLLSYYRSFSLPFYHPVVAPSAALCTAEASSTSVPSADIDVEPPDFDDDDEATALAAYAEECDLLEGLDAHADEIFSLSDLDDIDLGPQAQGVVRGESVDVEMS